MRGRSPGQSALEFVALLPVLFGIVALGIDFGMMGYSWVSVENGARECARMASLNCTDGSDDHCTTALVVARVVSRSSGIINLDVSTPPIDTISTWWCSHTALSTPPRPQRGDSVVVKVTHNYHFHFFPGNTVPLVSKLDMLVENADSQSGLPQGSIGSTTTPC